MKGDPRNSADWLKLARREIESGRRNLRVGDPHIVCYCAQQAAEKALKGWLIGQGWALVKTHDLKRLASEADSRGIDLSAFDAELARLSRLYFTDRYVDDSAEPDPDDSEAALLFEAIERMIDALFPPPPPASPA